jgi:hypothetical protein
MGWGVGGEGGMDLRQNCTFYANVHLLTVKKNNGIRKGAGAKSFSYITKYWRISLRVTSKPWIAGSQQVRSWREKKTCWMVTREKGSRCPTSPLLWMLRSTKYIYIKSTTVYVPSSELGGGGGAQSPAGEFLGSPNSEDWIKSLVLCLLYAYVGYHE